MYLLGFTIEDKGVRTSLVYRLAENESLDVFGSGMLADNDIEGILPVVINEHNGIQEVRCDIASRVSFETLLNGRVGRKELIGVFSGIIDVITHAGEYLLDTSMFVLEPAYIYVNPSNYSVYMLFLPVLRDEVWQLNERVRILFKNTMFSARFSVYDDSSYISEILNELNSDAAFSLSEFSNLLKKLNGEYITEPVNNMIQEEQESILYRTSDEAGDKAAESNSVGHSLHQWLREKLVHYGFKKDHSGKESVTKSKCDIHNINHIDTCNTDNAGSSLGISGFSMESGENQEKDSIIINTEKVPAMFENIDYCDETVMLVPSEIDSGIPYIIRSSTDERISLNKSIFRVGKESRYADYRITDNAAVSRAHAEFRINDGVCSLCDDNSLNHTYINDIMLEGQVLHELRNGDVIKFADEEFVFFC